MLSESEYDSENDEFSEDSMEIKIDNSVQSLQVVDSIFCDRIFEFKEKKRSKPVDFDYELELIDTSINDLHLSLNRYLDKVQNLWDTDADRL